MSNHLPNSGAALIPLAPAFARWRAYSYLALSMALVGSYVALSRPLLAAIPLFLLAWLRFGIGGLAMLHWIRPAGDNAPLPNHTRRLLWAESFFGNFLFTICMLMGVSRTSAVSAGVIMASIPAVVALTSWLWLKERIGLRIWLAVACAVLGIGLLAWGKNVHPTGSAPPSNGAGNAAQSQLLGDALVFAAVVCEAIYAVVAKKLSASVSPRRVAAIINRNGFLMMTPMGLYAAWQFDFHSVSAGAWLLLVFYAMAASVWTVWLWMSGLKNVPAAHAGIFTVMLPVSATAMGVWILKEPINTGQLLALGIALTGVLIATLPERQRNLEPTLASERNK